MICGLIFAILMKKQHYLMNLTIAAILTSFTMMSCENAPAKNDAGTATADSLKTPVLVNGITDANKGSKTGPVEVKGQMAAFKQGRV